MFKVYGNNIETIVQTDKGVFLVQSPDFPPGKGFEEFSEVPEGFTELNPLTFQGLEVPEEIL